MENSGEEKILERTCLVYSVKLGSDNTGVSYSFYVDKETGICLGYESSKSAAGIDLGVDDTVQTAQIDRLREQDLDAWLQVNYLYRSAGMPCQGNTKTTYYSVGEDFHAALLEELEKAEHFIFMEYFIVQEGTMWNPIHEILKEKAAQGVEVYFMYDDFGCIATLPWCYHEQLNAEGIHCAISNMFSPVLSHIHNNRDHRKICSDKCRNKWWNSHLDQVGRKAHYEFVCACCKKPFTAYGNSAISRIDLVVGRIQKNKNEVEDMVRAKENIVPVCEKYTLTIKETAAYFNMSAGIPIAAIWQRRG